MGVYIRILREEIKKQALSKIVPKVNGRIQKDFNIKKNKLLTKFDNHPVTQELKAGPGTESRFLSVGNLFSLLGFYRGEDPAGTVRQILQEDIELDNMTQPRITVGKTIKIEKRVLLPSQDEIRRKAADRLPLEWADRPWLDMIERGIAGFPRFLSNLNWRGKNKPSFKTSRSGTAIEIKTNLDRGSAPPIKYVSELMAYFRSLISGK